MQTLIVLCSDKKTINNLPLCLNRYPDGRLLAYKAIEGIMPKNYERIIYVLLKEQNDKYKIIKNLKNENIGYPLDFVVLDEMTSGPAETVAKIIKQKDIRGAFAVRDSHAYVELACSPRGNFVAGLDLTKYPYTINNLRNKSFIVVNEQNKILDIVEKHFCSDIFSTGFYGFESSEDFLFSYNRLRDINYNIDKLYLSHIISYLVGYKQTIYSLAETKEFEDWDTNYAWNVIKNRYATSLIKLEDNLLSKDSIKKLKILSDNGMKFIGYSNTNNVDKIVDKLNKYGITLQAIVNNWSYSNIINVISNVKELDDLYSRAKR